MAKPPPTGSSERTRGGRMVTELAPGLPEHTIVPRAPFCFRKAREVLASFSPGEGQVAVNGVVRRPFRVGGRTALATVVSHGSIERPRLGVTLAAADGGDDPDPALFLKAVADHLSVEDELEPLYQAGYGDPTFALIVERLYGLHQVRFPSPFASACWAVLSAHTPWGVARSLQSSLLRACRTGVEWGGGTLWAFPEPADLLGVGRQGLVLAVRSERKGGYLFNVAEAFQAEDDAFLRTADYDTVRERLVDIEGIGPWGASLVMIRGLGRMDRLPENEPTLAPAVSAVYGRGMTERDIDGAAERYGRWKGYWAYYVRVYAEHAVNY